MAQILKISAWHKTLESFGPIPYTHAGEPALVIPFDSEQVAFNAMFTDLTAAIDILTVRAEQGATIVADYDAVYAGEKMGEIRQFTDVASGNAYQLC